MQRHILAHWLVERFDLPKDTDPQRLALIEAFWRTLISDKFPKMDDYRCFLFTRADRPGRASRNIWYLHQLWHDSSFLIPDSIQRDHLLDNTFSTIHCISSNPLDFQLLILSHTHLRSSTSKLIKIFLLE